MPRIIVTALSVLGFVTTLIFMGVAVAAFSARGLNLAGLLILAALIIIAGAAWIASVIFFISSYLLTRDGSAVVMVLMLASSAVYASAGSAALYTSLSGLEVTSLDRPYMAIAGVVFIAWALLLALMGLKRR